MFDRLKIAASAAVLALLIGVPDPAPAQIQSGVGNPGGQPAATQLGFGGAPLLSGCGTGSPSVVGNSAYGTITTGTTATGCVLTWTNAAGVATPRIAPPVCLVTGGTTAALNPFNVLSIAATLTMSFASGSGVVYTYLCIGS